MAGQNISIKEISYNSEDYKNSVDLRERILRIPLSLKLNAADLLNENNDFHLACFNKDNQIIGIVVFSPKNVSNIRMRQLAVENDYQRQGIGGKLIAYGEKLVSGKGFNKITLSARKSALDFYLKNGYKITGDEYISDNTHIPHYPMEKEINK